jgi:hypothetical protein
LYSFIRTELSGSGDGSQRTSDTSLADDKEEGVKANSTRKGTEEVTRGTLAMRGAQRIEHNLLVLLQVNCRSILNKSSDFFNLIDIHNPDVIIGMESRLTEEISNTKVIRDDYIQERQGD